MNVPMHELTKRIDLNLGYACNIRCRFCYYQESLDEKGAGTNLSTAEAKRWISYFRKNGIEEIDLTGGEPTIRADIFELAAFCRAEGYKSIAVITNGLRMADEAFCEKLLAAGVNDVLFSFHGPNADIHDFLTRTPGCFEKISRAAANVRALSPRYPVRMRSNSVVNGVNYTVVEKTAEMLCAMGFSRLNFILFNPIVEAQNSDRDMNLTYAAAAPYLKAVLDKYGRSAEKITIRYMPFCLLPGYERFVTNTAQIQYDPDEWDYYLRTRFRNGVFLWLGALALGFLLHPSKSRFASIGWRAAQREAIKYALAFWNKVQGPPCKGCAYRRICDGLWRDYAAHQGFGELTAFKGPTISDPAHFMREIK